MAMYANGNQVSGCTSYASAVNYIEEDGSKSTVQDKISELSSNLPFKLGVDENGNYGYIKEGADTVTPFNKDLQFKIPYYGAYDSSYSKLEVFTYNVSNGNYKYLKYAYGGYVGFKLLGDSTTLDSANPTSAPNSINKSGIIDLSKYTSITVKNNGGIGLSSASITLTFTNNP